MVTIIGTEVKQNSKRENFVTLILQDGITMVQSKATGKFYATAQRASITCTFDEAYAKNLVGTKLSGKIEKASCEAYDYVIKESGETLVLEHTWVYNPNPTTVEEHVLGDLTIA